MDGLECSEILLSDIDTIKFRLDSDFYSKANLQTENTIRMLPGKTIMEIHAKMDCSAFYPSITEYYNKDGIGVPFLRVNEISNGLVQITDSTVFLPQEILDANSKTIAIAVPGDIVIAKGGNTLAKVGLVTDAYKEYAISRDVIVLHTANVVGVNACYLWAYLHSNFGQSILWRSASQTGQPHLTLPEIYCMNIPVFSSDFENGIEKMHLSSVMFKQSANSAYFEAERFLTSSLEINNISPQWKAVSIKSLKESFSISGRLDAEYYQPKYDELFASLEKQPTKPLGGSGGIVTINKSIEPGSDAYCDEGIPFVRVSNVTKFGISNPEIKLSNDVVADVSALYPHKNTILFSKDGSVGIAYKVEEDLEIITSGALLHLTVNNPEEILPDYLTLVLNSKVVQLQAERDSSGAIIQHWKPSEIEKVIIPILDLDVQKQIAEKIQESLALRHQSERLLEYAKQAVEIAIEQGEEKAMRWLKDKVK